MFKFTLDVFGEPAEPLWTTTFHGAPGFGVNQALADSLDCPKHAASPLRSMQDTAVRWIR